MADTLEGATREIQTEIGYINWLSKIVERCTLALLCMREKQDKIQETDYEILQVMHKSWFNGEFPIFQTITIPDKTKSTQPSLFDDRTSDATANNNNGKMFVSDTTEPKTETK
jgi:hypothetical protein